jgi:hypothetical protein
MTFMNGVVAWFPMVFLGIINGAIRQFGYGRSMSDSRSHQLSSLIGLLLLVAYISIITIPLPLHSSQQAMMVGLMWLCLTVTFEFPFGHYVAKHSWHRLRHDYNLTAGRLWLLFPAAVAATPYLIFRIRS